MAWADTLLEASFRGIVFDIVKTDDTADRALVEHTYPYVDGADVEDMGRGARKISVEAIFYGDTYETELNAFLLALDGYDARFADPKGHPNAYLTHPVFGEILVKVGRYAVHHEAENVDQASVTIEFVESTPGNPFFDAAQVKKNADAIAAKSTLAKAAAVNKYATLIEKMHAASPMAGLQNLRAAITGPILAAMDFANVVLANLDVLAYPRAWANDFSTLIGGALDIRTWGQQLEADWASIKSTFGLLDVFKTASPGVQPAPVDTSSAAAPAEAQAVAVTQATVEVFVACALADAATLAFAALADTPMLAPAQIEAMANTVRAAIEGAIEHCIMVYALEDSRAITEPLKDLALAIQDAAAALIEARPSLVQRKITAPGNMRLIAHHLYGDHTRATELYRLNGARSPFVETGDVINAYAS